MHTPSPRAVLPWLLGASLMAVLVCLAAAVFIGLSAREDAANQAAARMAAQAEGFARDINADIALFDLALREAEAMRDPGRTPWRLKLLELPLTARYVGFMNVLNEVGDVVADSRSNVSRPANFAGRDYFQDQLKNPGDSLMIGRPFGTAPNQHASIPISRRLTKPDGAFAGVVVAGIHLDWLSDLLSHKLPGPPFSVTVRRADGLILMRSPFDENVIGHAGADDPAWREFLRTGESTLNDSAGGIRSFRRIGTAPLVLELSLDHEGVFANKRPWLILLPALVLIPGLFVLLLGFFGHRVQRLGRRIEAGANAAGDEQMRVLAAMSHELRTPLMGILGQVELMVEEGGLSDHQTMRLTRLTGAGMLMRNIINRVIDVVRPGDPDEPPVAAPCDLDALIRGCLSMFESETRKKGLHLTSGIAPATPRYVMLARDLVEQVLINLLMNAVKYTARGTVALRVNGDAAHLRFEVADTGTGIPRGKWHRLFHEYDRLESTGGGVEGNGIGLSISERFVRRMGGRIGYQENVSGGSLFWVEIPTTETNAPSDAVAVKQPSAPAAACPLRVLLVDDLDLTRAVTADFLRQEGHWITEAINGEAAIETAADKDFDLILMDMRMPIMDGLEATRRIRALPGHRGDTPIVLVTADLVALGEGASGRAGVDLCLMKPYTRSELLATVAKAARPIMAQTDDETAEVLDEAAFMSLRHQLGDAKFASHVDAATRRVEDFIALLETRDAAESIAVRDAAHDLVGVTGLLGLVALAFCLRRFDIADDRAVIVDALREAAQQAMARLRQQHATMNLSPQ